MKEYMTVREMQAYMHVSKKTAYKLLDDKKISCFHLSPRKTLVNVADVDKFIEKYRT